MSIVSKFKSYFMLDDEYEYKENIVEEKGEETPVKSVPKSQGQNSSSPQNVVSLQSVQKTSKVILFEPRSYPEAQEIADHLKNRKAVVVNLHSLAHDQARRIVDFLSGTVYAIGGDIQKVGVDIFLCTPDNVDVSGSISSLPQEQTENLRW